LSSLLGRSASQSSPLVPLHSVGVMSMHPERTVGRLRYALGGDRPSQTPRLALSGAPLQGTAVRRKAARERYFTAASAPPERGASKAPAYPTQARPRAQAKVE